MSGPKLAETNADGGRWYVHPTTGERFISVTTVLSDIARFGLTDWAGRLAAEAAMERLDWLNRAAQVDDCNSTKTEDACGECPACVTSWLANRHNDIRDAAGERGRKLHEAAEQETLFGEGATVDEDIQPYVDGFRLWCDRWRPTFLASEMTVISRKWGYAGTLDGIVQLDDPTVLPKTFQHLAGLPLCADWKTGKHVDIPKGWQVVAYSNADAVLLPDGEELPMPDIKGGLLLHLRPRKVQVREVYLTELAFAYFRNLLHVAEGLDAGLNSVLSRPHTLKET